MKRMLLSTIGVVLLLAVAAQFVRLQECEATTAAELAFASRDIPLEVSVVDAVENEPLLAQAGSIPVDPAPAFAFPQANPSAIPISPQSKRFIKVPVTKTVYEEVAVDVGAVTPLQQRYSVLMLKRAQRMSEEELKAEIAEVEAELQQQDEAADSELQKAIEILENLQQDSDGTPAAGRARQALPLLNGRSNAPVPVYDDGSGTVQPNVPFYEPS